MTTTSIFEPYRRKNYPYVFDGAIRLHSIQGGVPLDPDVLRGHLARKVNAADDVIRSEVATIMLESGITLEEAVEEVAQKSLVGFAKDEHGCYIGGYQLKACLKEAANIAASEKRLRQGWGQASPKGKALKSWFPEHVFVLEDRIPLGASECDEVKQSFVHVVTRQGPQTAVKYAEMIYDADIEFTIETDHDFKDDEWAAIWTTAEQMGLGAGRSMGNGRFAVTRWLRRPSPHCKGATK